MLCAVRLKGLNSATKPNCDDRLAGGLSPCRRLVIRLPQRRRLASLSLQSTDASSGPSMSSQFTSTIGSYPTSALQLSQWNLTQRHIVMLNFIACAAAISASWLFFSIIPTLLGFKRAVESLEKLLDVTREELPDTMAAVRLSGVEISDLTMELSDLGKGITQGVRSSTQAVRLAEERLWRLTNMGPSASMQEAITMKTTTRGPTLARSARRVKEVIVKGRSIFQAFFTLTRFSKIALVYFTYRAKP